MRRSGLKAIPETARSTKPRLPNTPKKMRHGDWREIGGRPIERLSTGRLLNGQHRLHAVICAGGAVRLLVAVYERTRKENMNDKQEEIMEEKERTERQRELFEVMKELCRLMREHGGIMKQRAVRDVFEDGLALFGLPEYRGQQTEYRYKKTPGVKVLDRTDGKVVVDSGDGDGIK